jgi:hypothetical protein
LIHTYQNCLEYLRANNIKIDLSRQSISDGNSLYSSTVYRSDREFNGYSLGSPDCAFKSTIEAVERLIITEFSNGEFYSSSGFALASDLIVAESKAKYELIERDNIARFLRQDPLVASEEINVYYPTWFSPPGLILKCIKIINPTSIDSLLFLNVSKDELIHSWGSCLVSDHADHGINEAVLSSIIKNHPTKLKYNQLHICRIGNEMDRLRPEISKKVMFSREGLVLVKAHSENLLDYSRGVRDQSDVIYSVDQHLDRISAIVPI